MTHIQGANKSIWGAAPIHQALRWRRGRLGVGTVEAGGGAGWVCWRCWRRCWRRWYCRVPTPIERLMLSGVVCSFNAISSIRCDGIRRSPRDHRETSDLETGGAKLAPNCSKVRPWSSQRSKRLDSYASSSGILFALLPPVVCRRKGAFVNWLTNYPPKWVDGLATVDKGSRCNYNQEGKVRLHVLSGPGYATPGPEKRNASTLIFDCAFNCGRSNATKRALAQRTAEGFFQKMNPRREESFCLFFHYTEKEARCQDQDKSTGEIHDWIATHFDEAGVIASAHPVAAANQSARLP
jgi:hypothetical protein